MNKLEFTERQCLLTALSQVKDRMRLIERYMKDMPPKEIALEWHRLNASATHLEKLLQQLNFQEGLYEHQDSHR